MKLQGFTLSRIVVSGPGLPDAEVSFEKGLNVITGPSNTGKSYIVETIDYIFGADEPPGEDIKEARGYDTAFLEINCADGRVLTFQRSLLGGDLAVLEGSYADRASNKKRLLSTESQAKKVETLSAFLLGLVGIQSVKVRTNALGETVNLTFRMLNHLFVVDETSIIAKKRSPVRLTSGFAKTASDRVFNYLITGEDDHSIIAVAGPKEKRAQTQGKKEVYDELIQKLEAQLNSVNVEDIRSQLSALEGTIDASIESLKEKTSVIREYQLQRQSALNLQQEAESRLIVIGELLNRFSILKTHYSSDLERLEFISEGDHYFEQLVPMKCPICGTLLADHAAQKMCSDRRPELNNVQEACRAEGQKIRTHLADLEKTIASLELERETVKTNAKSSEIDIGHVDTLLANELKPTFQTEKDSLDKLLSKRAELAEIESSLLALEGYRNARASLEDIPQEEEKKFSGLSVGAARQFSDVIQDLLRKWKFLKEGEIVEFNEQRMDIVVNGKHRQSNGKGLRGFLHGAFTIGLMRYCRSNNLPHPGFVVLDSPITSYREGRVEDAEDEAPPEVQASFWDHLASSSENQVIIVENKEPTPSAREHCHYVHFYGPHASEARKGFFPERTSQ